MMAAMALRLVSTPLPDPNPDDTLGERIESARGFRRLTQKDVVAGMAVRDAMQGRRYDDPSPPGLRAVA